MHGFSFVGPSRQPFFVERLAPRRWLTTALAFCSFLALASACDRPGKKDGQGEGDSTEEEEKKPAAVYVAPIGRRNLIGKVAAASTIEAELKVEVHAETNGRLVGLRGEEGMHVEKGEVLAQIRRDAQTSSLERADTVLIQAQRDYDRLVALQRDGVVGQAELDAASDKVRAAQLDLRDRKRDLSNTAVLVPFSGMLTERHVAPGSYVAMGAKLFTLVDFGSLVARVHLPEKELDHVAVGQEVAIASKTVKGRLGRGKVARISPVIDPTTGTFRVTVALPVDLAGTAKGFLPGMYAEVVLTTEHRDNVIAVPKSALIYEGAQVFAFVEKDGQAKRRKVETGLVDGEWIEVINGLAADERLVVAGQQGLRDGTKVEVQVPTQKEVGDHLLENGNPSVAAAHEVKG